MDRCDCRADPGDAEGEEAGAAEKSAGGRVAEAFQVGGDAGGEIFEFEAGDDDGEDEGGQSQPRRARQEPVEEQFGAGNDKDEPGNNQREGGERSDRGRLRGPSWPLYEDALASVRGCAASGF